MLRRTVLSGFLCRPTEWPYDSTQPPLAVDCGLWAVGDEGIDAWVMLRRYRCVRTTTTRVQELTDTRIKVSSRRGSVTHAQGRLLCINAHFFFDLNYI